MPVYDYQCLKCGVVTEIVKKMSEPHPTICHKCGEDGLVQIHTSPAAISFKGKGWFKTDGKY